MCGGSFGRLPVNQVLTVCLATALLLAGAPTAAQANQVVSISSVVPSIVGSAASTTVLVRGIGFSSGQSVELSGCPNTNPQAVYPVQQFQVVNDTTMLVTTPDIIPAGTCTLTVAGARLSQALTFVDAPERLTLQITNDTDADDEDLWITLGYNCPRVIPSPPYPPGSSGCSTDGRSNPNFAWPATASSSSANRYWYEVYTDDSPIPAFTGIRFTDLAPVANKLQARELSIANIDSGVVYFARGSPVNTGASPIGRAPSYVTSQQRFDVFELTFHGSGASTGASAPGGSWTSPVYANITAVAGVSMLMDLSGWDNSMGALGPSPQRIGAGVSWKAGTTIDDLVTTLSSAGVNVDDTSVVVTNDGRPYRPETFVRIVSPSTNGGSGYANLQGSTRSYLAWLTRQERRFAIVGLYSGAGIGSGTWYCYRTSAFSRRIPTQFTGSYGYPTRSSARAAAKAGCEPVGVGVAGPRLTTATSPVSGKVGPVTSAAVYMQDNRYVQDGKVAVGNDLANAVYRDFIVSFAYGYWGSRAGSAGWTTLSWSTAKGSTPAFSRGWPAFFQGTRFPRWNAYAEAVWKYTNAYGMPYSDTFGNGGRGNPLVSGSAISSLRLSIH